MRVSATDEASARYSRWRLTASWTRRDGDRREDGEHDRDDEHDRLEAIAAALAVAGPATAAPEREPQEEVGKQGDRPDEDAHEQREPDVVVADVGQLVADDALELFPVELLEEAGRDRDGCVLGVAAGGEGVGRGVVDDVDLGHRHIRRQRQLLDDVQQLRRGLGVDLVGARRGQHERVAAEERPDRQQPAARRAR